MVSLLKSKSIKLDTKVYSAVKKTFESGGLGAVILALQKRKLLRDDIGWSDNFEGYFVDVLSGFDFIELDGVRFDDSKRKVILDFYAFEVFYLYYKNIVEEGETKDSFSKFYRSFL